MHIYPYLQVSPRCYPTTIVSECRALLDSRNRRRLSGALSSSGPLPTRRHDAGLPICYLLDDILAEVRLLAVPRPVGNENSNPASQHHTRSPPRPPHRPHRRRPPPAYPPPQITAAPRVLLPLRYVRNLITPSIVRPKKSKSRLEQFSASLPNRQLSPSPEWPLHPPPNPPPLPNQPSASTSPPSRRPPSPSSPPPSSLLPPATLSPSTRSQRSPSRRTHSSRSPSPPPTPSRRSSTARHSAALRSVSRRHAP